MAVYLTNGFESGTSGSAFTDASSAPPAGAGNELDANSTGTGGSLTYENTEAAHGSLSLKVVCGSSGGTNIVEWTTSLTGSSLSQIWFRVYIWMAALPTSGNTVTFIRTRAGSTTCGQVAINSSGKVLTLNASGSTQTTSTTTVPTSQWFRLEGYVIGSPTAGSIQVKIFTTSKDELTPDETDTTGTSVNTDSASMTRIDFGPSAASAAFTCYIDDIGASDTAYLGPSQLSGSPSAALTLAASVTGSSKRSGSPSGAVSLSATATGTRQQAKAASAAVTLASGAAGQRQQAKTASAAVTLGATAAGVPVRSGSPGAAVTLAASATGSSERTGTPAAAAALAASATGSSSRTGSPDATLTLGASAVGSLEHSGSATAGITLAASAAGSKRVTASPAATIALSAVAAGVKRVMAAASAVVTLAARAIGFAAEPLDETLTGGSVTTLQYAGSAAAAEEFSGSVTTSEYGGSVR
jgi:hypothetical protein